MKNKTKKIHLKVFLIIIIFLGIILLTNALSIQDKININKININKKTNLTNLIQNYKSVFPYILSRYDKNFINFKGIEINNETIFYLQRKINNAIVEGDYKIYYFNKKTNKLISKKIKWRRNLPYFLPKIISQKQAESMVPNSIRSSLFYISPDSKIFSTITPTPKNPCWVVKSLDKNNGMIWTVIDAVSGKILGKAIPPPYTAFSMTGPQAYSGGSCSGSWTSWMENARDWFNAMGYSTETAEWPTSEKIQEQIQSPSIALFYEEAHGGYTSFRNHCEDGVGNSYIYWNNISKWIKNYNKMPFAFLGSCDSHCNVSNGTMSYEFRKGSNKDTATVGYCGMSTPNCEDNCWPNSLDWQDKFFQKLYYGYTIKQAYDYANTQYPACANCIKIAGDPDLKLVPKIKREPDCGDNLTKDIVLSRNLSCSGNGLIIKSSDITIDCQNHSITGSNSGIGIDLKSYDRITIKNCKINKFNYGIKIQKTSDNNILKNNEIYSNDYGVFINDSWNNNITQNKIYNNTNSLYLLNIKYNLISSNNISNNENIGVFLYNSNNNKLIENTICKNNYDLFENLSSSNFGNNNKCDKPDGWKDNETYGCDFHCEKNFGLITYYKFENNIDDSTGIYNGTNNGALFVEGKSGLGVYFDGTKDNIWNSTTNRFEGGVYITTPLYLNHKINNYTYSFWLKPKSAGGFYAIEDYWMGCGIDKNKKILCQDGDGDHGISNNPINLNEWNHIAFVYNSPRDYTIYINGIKSGSFKTDEGFTKNFTIGQGMYYLQYGAGITDWGNENFAEFNGTIDEVKIFNVTLSNKEINQLYTEFDVQNTEEPKKNTPITIQKNTDNTPKYKTPQIPTKIKESNSKIPEDTKIISINHNNKKPKSYKINKKIKPHNKQQSSKNTKQGIFFKIKTKIINFIKRLFRI